MARGYRILTPETRNARLYVGTRGTESDLIRFLYTCCASGHVRKLLGDLADAIGGDPEDLLVHFRRIGERTMSSQTLPLEKAKADVDALQWEEVLGAIQNGLVRELQGLIPSPRALAYAIELLEDWASLGRAALDKIGETSI